MRKAIIALGLAIAMTMALALAPALPDRKPPIDVQVVNGQVVVLEDPAYTTAGEGAIVWQVVTPGYQLAANGIVVASNGLHVCSPFQAVKSGQGFRCMKKQHVPGAKYKYTVNLINTATNKPLSPLDPFIVNN